MILKLIEIDKYASRLTWLHSLFIIVMKKPKELAMMLYPTALEGVHIVRRQSLFEASLALAKHPVATE